MKNRISGLIISTVLIMTVITATAQKKQQHANVKGTWAMTVETSAGSGSPVFELQHVTDTSLSGTYSGRLGKAEVKGTVEGNVIHLEFTISGNVIEYDGTVEDDTMKGKVKLGSMGEGTFTGSKKKS
jgi:hypothetical protein